MVLLFCINLHIFSKSSCNKSVLSENLKVLIELFNFNVFKNLLKSLYEI